MYLFLEVVITIGVTLGGGGGGWWGKNPPKIFIT
jgi:hypothetical protein